AYVNRDIFNGAFSNSPFLGFNTGIRELNHNAAINWMYAFGSPGCCPGAGSSNWIMNVKAQYERINLNRQADFNTFGPRLFLTGAQGVGFGGVSTGFPGDLPFNPGLNSLLTGPLNLFQIPVDFFGTWGNHQFRFGGSYYYWQDNRTIASFQNDTFTLQGGALAGLNGLVSGTASTFSTAFRPPTGGLDPGAIIPASALVVDPTVVGSPPILPDFNRSLSAHDFSLYFSDIWRVSPSISVLLGLRYDYFGVPRSRNDQIFLNFFPGVGSDIFTNVANGMLAAPGTTLIDGTVTDDRFFDRDGNNFAPRLGFAWDIGGGRGGCCGGGMGRTTLRAGYGISYERLFYGVSPFFQNRTDFAIQSMTAGVPLPTTPVTSIPATPLSTTKFGPLLGGTTTFTPLVRGIETNLRTPYVHFWNVSLEREIATNTVAALQYVGSAGRNLFTFSNINRPGSAAAFLDPTADPVARLNPVFGPIFFLTDDGRSNYNAFIAEVTSSTWRNIGLQFTARYRFSKALDNISTIFGNNVGFFGTSLTPNLLSPFDPDFDYGPSDWDATHRFIGSFNWEFPFGARGCCGGGSDWRDWLFGGWGVGGIFAFQSGLPFNVFNCADAFSAETPCARAGLASGVVISDINRPSAGDAVASTTIPNFFNFLGGGAFVPATGFAPATALVPGAPINTSLPPFPINTPGRNFFRGPNFWNFDFGVYKRFRLTEDVSVQIRSEFYNIFNHTNLFVPNSVDIGATPVDASGNPFVPAFRNGARFIQFGAKFIF
ncbi:MAG: TonB-dependent receptor domain-containing protein, partial [Blastocatellia bacterium]